MGEGRRKVFLDCLSVLQPENTVNPEITVSFIFVNSFKRHYFDVKNVQLGHYLTGSVNNILILPFCEDFIFTKLCLWEVWENKTLAKISKFTVVVRSDHFVCLVCYLTSP